MKIIVENDFQLSPYKMRENQYLTPVLKHMRLEGTRALLGEVKAGMAQREIAEHEVFSRH